MKTAGQAAFEAYQKHLASQDALLGGDIAWETMQSWPAEVQAWEAAAKAVIAFAAGRDTPAE